MTCPDPPARRRRDAQATREDLLRAARRRFAAVGYERTTTRDVAAEVGVNVALINRYFGSKDGLIEAVLAESPDFLPPTLADGDCGSFIDRMLASLDRTGYSGVEKHHPVVLFLRDAGEDPRVQELRVRAIEAFARAVADEADPALSAGERHVGAQLVVALLVGTAVLRDVLPLDPLATTDIAALRQPLTTAITALLGRDGAPRR